MIGNPILARIALDAGMPEEVAQRFAILGNYFFKAIPIRTLIPFLKLAIVPSYQGQDEFLEAAHRQNESRAEYSSPWKVAARADKAARIAAKAARKAALRPDGRRKGKHGTGIREFSPYPSRRRGSDTPCKRSLAAASPRHTAPAGER